MKMSKIYLLMCATGSWNDYRNEPIEAFESKELAEKVANGFNNAMEFAAPTIKEKIVEADRLEDEFYGIDSEIDRTQEEVEVFQKQFFKDYGFYDNVRWYGFPTYSVQEIDLIN